MNEVGVCRVETAGSHIGCDLAAMIDRMHHHVQQDILLLAAEGFAFCVLVTQRPGKGLPRQAKSNSSSKDRQLIDFQFALLDREYRPHRQALLLNQQPFEP